jgi:hypothetical protein
MRFLFFTCLFFASISADAQLRYGFKTGLNFARFDAESEIDASGKNLETWKNLTGFHIGATFHYMFTNYLGARAEVLYSKKGSKYTFDSDLKDASFKYFRTNSGAYLLTKSDKYRYLVNISNSYIDIPLTVFFRWKDFEIGGGASLGILIASNGQGSMTYSGRTADLNNKITPEVLEINLQQNYLRDKPGEADENAETVAVRLNAVNLNVPKTQGAYFDAPEGTPKLFNRLDFAVIGDLKYYLNRSLFFGVRVQKGLSDLTNDEADFSKTQLPDTGLYLNRKDMDTNFIISASVGFSF